jgi:hypothetical protein
MFLKIINEHLAISSAMEYTCKKNPHPSDRYGPNRLIWLELSTGVACRAADSISARGPIFAFFIAAIIFKRWANFS